MKLHYHRSTFALLPLLLIAAASTWGCAGPTDSRIARHNVALQSPTDGTSTDSSADPDGTTTTTTTVKGKISSAGSGATTQGLAGKDILTSARTVRFDALQANGDLVPVKQVTVEPGGSFDAAVPANESPTGIFIMKVLDIGGAVVGSGVVNGLPAFIQAFTVDATVDTVTSFKAEVLVTLAKKGVPGVQNYINVINAFVDAELANSIAVIGVVATDLNSLISAVSAAVVAGENVIVDALQKAGLPIDATALEKAQATLVSSAEGIVTDAKNTLTTSDKSLVAGLEAATAAAAAPVDKAIFNAVMNGGVAFKQAFQQGLTGSGVDSGATGLNFSVSKTLFGLQASLSTSAIQGYFANAAPEVANAMTKACAAFTNQIAQATTAADLNAAKAQLTNGLLGVNGNMDGSVLQLLAAVITDLITVANDVKATLDPLTQTLTTALTQDTDATQIANALTAFDQNSQNITSALQKVLNGKDAQVVVDALNVAQKVIVL